MLSIFVSKKGILIPSNVRYAVPGIKQVLIRNIARHETQKRKKDTRFVLVGLLDLYTHRHHLFVQGLNSKLLREAAYSLPKMEVMRILVTR